MVMEKVKVVLEILQQAVEVVVFVTQQVVLVEVVVRVTQHVVFVIVFFIVVVVRTLGLAEVALENVGRRQLE